jgi:hypothetical protein
MSAGCGWLGASGLQGAAGTRTRGHGLRIVLLMRLLLAARRGSVSGAEAGVTARAIAGVRALMRSGRGVRSVVSGTHLQSFHRDPHREARTRAHPYVLASCYHCSSCATDPISRHRSQVWVPSLSVSRFALASRSHVHSQQKSRLKYIPLAAPSCRHCPQ